MMIARNFSIFFGEGRNASSREDKKTCCSCSDIVHKRVGDLMEDFFGVASGGGENLAQAPDKFDAKTANLATFQTNNTTPKTRPLFPMTHCSTTWGHRPFLDGLLTPPSKKDEQHGNNKNDAGTPFSNSQKRG